ncbi:MAG: hypothetical protein B7X00_00615 [Legionella sp. 21-45-4]|nr:MAG: hypothetical protein B7X00_00615 [Legionella sp. 21-45-4]
MGVKIMKKDKKPRFNFIRRRFPVLQWMNLSRLVTFFIQILGMARDVLVIQKKAPNQTFEEARLKLGLSDAEIQAREMRLFFISVFMLCLAMGVLGYSLYELFHSQWRSALISIVLTGLSLSFAFRYHFWFTQLKTRTLGLSFTDWCRFLLGGE